MLLLYESLNGLLKFIEIMVEPKNIVFSYNLIWIFLDTYYNLFYKLKNSANGQLSNVFILFYMESKFILPTKMG